MARTRPAGDRPDPAEVAAQLSAIRRAVDAGELDCPPALRHHLGGAVAALDATTRRARPPTEERP